MSTLRTRHPIRVLQLVPTLQRRGIEKVVCAIALSLNGNGYEVNVCCQKSKGPLEDVLTRQGIDVYCIEEQGSRDIAAARRLLTLLRRGRYDIVHLHCVAAASYPLPAAWIARVPKVVCTFHGFPGAPAPPLVEAKRRIRGLVARLVSRHVDWTYACSAAALSAHQNDGWRGSRSSVIYNGIDRAEFQPAVDREAARIALGILGNGPVIGSVGSFCREKGHSHLMRAFARLRSKVPDACLLLVGSGPDAALLATLACECGCADAIHFVGEHAEVAKCMQAMDVFVLPSLTEGFGLALAEAMACGVPVVASAVGGVPELVADGVSGLLVPPGDPAALAAAIGRVLESPELAKELSTRALRDISDNFSVGRMTRQVSELYAGLVRGTMSIQGSVAEEREAVEGNDDSAVRSIPRVLHCFGGMELGGAETFAMHVYRSVDRSRVQFDFAVSAEKSCTYDEEIRGLGGRIIRHQAPSKAGFRNYGRELKRILQQCGPFRAVHSHLSYFSGFVLKVAASEGVPVRISHMHSTRDARSGTLSGFAYHSVMRRLIQRYATHIFGCSRGVLGATFGDGWSSDPRMAVMRNGIDLAPYSMPCPSQTELRKQLSLPPEGKILGHIGNLNASKNHRFLIELFREYLERDSKATLVLVGDGTLRSEIERQVEVCSLGKRVRLLGRRPQTEIPGLLAAFDVLVMPSIHEGLPVSLIEAQAAGVPCVVSNGITKEVDLGLGLLEFVDLRGGPAQWMNRIDLALRRQRPCWETRRDALILSGYDTNDASSALYRVYQKGSAGEERGAFPAPESCDRWT